MHSEKFWNEHFNRFEMLDFAYVKRIAEYLSISSDTETLQVACFDLGMFVCKHPFGRQVLNNMGLDVKKQVGGLVYSKDEKLSQLAL